MSDAIRFQIHTGFTEYNNPTATIAFAYGETDEILAIGSSRVFLSFELIEPLLNANITIAERVLCNYQIAGTLLHEIGVRLLIALRSRESK